jgi:threonine aldolase
VPRSGLASPAQGLSSIEQEGSNKAFGGGFRQAGIIAAGALYALESHRHRLGEIHARAAAFARNLASYPEVEIDPATVETNIVRFRLRSLAAGQFDDEAHRLGVHMLPSGPNAVRAVFYLDITDSDVERAEPEVSRASP